MQHLRRRLALAAIVVLAALPAAAPVAARDSARAEHDRITGYWTAARMQSAIPRDFVKVGGSFQPKAKPGGDGAVKGASWTSGGPALTRTGKVFFTMSGVNYVCSGSVATDSRTGYSLVLTAGHCAYDEVARAFATNWTFVPQYDSAPTSACAQTTHGCWTAQGLVVHRGYATAGGFNTQATVHDFAFAIVAGGGKSGTAQLDATVGSFGVSTSGVSAGDKLYAFGYPAAGRYKGKDLVYCAGNIITDQYNDDLTWGMACNMTGGSSGGPWLGGFEASQSNATLSSLNSYGYLGLSNMYGPKFNQNTAAVYNAANGATGNVIVQ
jgi:hypothetical protein